MASPSIERVPSVDWVAVDWGTSRVRLWTVDGRGSVLRTASSERGMSRLAPDEFEPELLRLLGNELPAGRATPVVCCGMVGAREGWMQAGYREVPCDPSAAGHATLAPALDRRLDVHVVPGLSQPEPADVMRGEETQLAGLLERRPGFDGVACLPGTHAKWARLRGGRVETFRTCLTGELFELLAERSVLRHSVDATGSRGDGFVGAVRVAAREPAAALAGLFSLRAEHLLYGLDPSAARDRLSGTLIGLELAAVRPWFDEGLDGGPDGGALVVVGDGELADAYVEALAAIDRRAVREPAAPLTLAGLASVHRRLDTRDGRRAS